jgi:hypothetical protein
VDKERFMSSKSAFKGEMDMSYKVGDVVGVPCTIQAGPFPDEKLVTVDTSEGQISGFVKQSNLQSDAADPEHGQIKGQIIEVAGDLITVKLFGSFFTTALGFASVSKANLSRMVA